MAIPGQYLRAAQAHREEVIDEDNFDLYYFGLLVLLMDFYDLDED